MRTLAMVLVALSTSAGRADTARERLAKLAREYRIEVVVVDQPIRFVRNGYGISAEPVPAGALARYEPIFEREWRRYPKSLMARTRLNRIVLGANVQVIGQPRAAVPEFDQGWFWLDAAIGSTDTEYGRHVIHHDFFHMIDERHSPSGRIDPNWERLNPPNVKYGKGGWFMQKGNVGALRNDLPGFLDESATSAVEEDKAEVFSFLLTDTAFVNARIKADPIIANKVARIKALTKAFEPQMDEGWFARNGH